MKFLIETGSESHTTSWQRCNASTNGKPLYQLKQHIVSQEWLTRNKHATCVKTVYELPNGTEILIDYRGYEGPQKLLIRLDEASEVQTQEIGTSRLRTYTLKGRYIIVRDLEQEAAQTLRQSQEEGF